MRSHGALRVVRAGSQPYGVLPVTSLERWSLLDPADVDAVAPPLLRALAPAWRAATAALPRVTPEVAIEDVVVEALTMSPVSVGFAARALELQPATGLGGFTTRQSALEAVRALGLDLDPLLSRAGFEAAATPLTGPLVADEPSETDPLPPDGDYVAWLAAADLETLRTGSPPKGGNTLLFTLLRHALLREYVSTTVRILRARGIAEPGEGAEPPAPSPWTRLAAPLDGATLASHLDAARAAGTPDGSPVAAQLTPLLDLQASLRRLSRVPTARLARLLAGTLDLASHRLDAWIGAHAARRLATLREQRPRGARIGGYGVVEDVRPTVVEPTELEVELAAATARDETAAQALATAESEVAAAHAGVGEAEARVASLEAELADVQEQSLAAQGDPEITLPMLRFLHRRQTTLQGSLTTARAAVPAAGNALAAAESAALRRGRRPTRRRPTSRASRRCSPKRRRRRPSR